jgi:plasmid maintenance system antidote protein VapI
VNWLFCGTRDPLSERSHALAMCTMSYTLNMTGFGDYVRAARATRAETDMRFSLRQVAQRIGVQPAYLSKVERGLVAPPSEATIIRLATDLGEDPDVLLALAGKVGERPAGHNSAQAEVGWGMSNGR